MPIKYIKLLALPCILLHLTCTSFGQTPDKTIDGFNIQGIARDPLGSILSDKSLRIVLTFSSVQGSTIPYFTEIHQVTTDEVGLFATIAGAGQVLSGSFADIPWGQQVIWIDYAFYDGNGSILIGKQSHEVMAVPYAFHAISASRLLDSLPVTEKNKSIRWTTSGNSGIYPNTNFIGTIDDRDLVLKANNETNAILTNTGQFQVHGRVAGENEDPANYPLVVEGSSQGIHITVNGARNGDTHFVTFADDYGIQGRIEGQTESELTDSWPWQLQMSSFGVRIASLIAQSVALGIEAHGLYAAGVAATLSVIFSYQAFPYLAAAAATTFNAAALGIDIAALEKEWTTWQSNTLNEVGVTYESGAGDYAEWLERTPWERDLTFGEIVGVKAGKISLNTSDADHLLVISKKPIVLGNLPPSGKTEQFEKTAFLGQVYARVVGPVSVGDYILPSGNHDGLGIAVNPAKMAIRDYSRIVGVAWESSTNHPIRLVKICVGQSTDQFAPAVEGIEKKLDKIKAYLGEKPAQQIVAPPINRNLPLSQTKALIQDGRLSEHLLSIEAFDEYVDKNAENIKKLYAKIESSLIAKGVKLHENSEARQLFLDPIGQLKANRRKLEGAEFLKSLDSMQMNK